MISVARLLPACGLALFSQEVWVMLPAICITGVPQKIQKCALILMSSSLGHQGYQKTLGSVTACHMLHSQQKMINRECWEDPAGRTTEGCPPQGSSSVSMYQIMVKQNLRVGVKSENK